ncbi:MAG: hypothetical protein COX62_07340 [Deltaproteobacteria bacterium CG_4_10_14_0_2_um_filter_43_8]|nr:MAG: hypothetical protein COV43_07115 [Deltaproteobacteria bacterium CG11_big_fil_rev_8_21_14_0_20_42_23]PJA19059.1 MAG: hypothetical protein COX62_07340 [Deltaproteobacteria bacterium CG_4_10_14_0_2_um_filter_43_8]PJC64166.1 MAG: hypothetical protein CO021_05480 [Deltaproteobacteria bacterium CG_4_9_14_0_2_um_filter_42_21]
MKAFAYEATECSFKLCVSLRLFFIWSRGKLKKKNNFLAHTFLWEDFLFCASLPLASCSF